MLATISTSLYLYLVGDSKLLLPANDYMAGVLVSSRFVSLSSGLRRLLAYCSHTLYLHVNALRDHHELDAIAGYVQYSTSTLP